MNHRITSIRRKRRGLIFPCFAFFFIVSDFSGCTYTIPLNEEPTKPKISIEDNYDYPAGGSDTIQITIDATIDADFD